MCVHLFDILQIAIVTSFSLISIWISRKINFETASPPRQQLAAPILKENCYFQHMTDKCMYVNFGILWRTSAYSQFGLAVETSYVSISSRRTHARHSSVCLGMGWTWWKLLDYLNDNHDEFHHTVYDKTGSVFCKGGGSTDACGCFKEADGGDLREDGKWRNHDELHATGW